MTRGRITLVCARDPDQLADFVFGQLAEHSHLWPDQRAFVLVPETLKADMERRYLSGERARGLMMAEVLSFRRFAARLFAESGRAGRPPISGSGKAALTQGILQDPGIPFRRFNRLASRPRYAAELNQVLGDFHRYGISSEDLRNHENLSPPTADKLHDFALLKEALDEAIAVRGLDDPDTVLTRLADLLSESVLPDRLAFLRQSHVWVTGFGSSREFTSQEMRLIGSLAALVPSLTLTLVCDAEERDPAFRIGRRSLESLQDFFPQAEHILLPAPPPRKPLIRFVRSPNRREEARFTAGEIRRLLLTGSVRRKDIGIALCETDQSPIFLESALKDYGIDAYIDAGQSLQHTSLVRMLSAFLAVCDYDFQLDDLMAYYRSGLSGLADDAIDRFENAALARDWRRARDFRKLTESPEIIREAALKIDGQGNPNYLAVETVLANIGELLRLGSRMRQARNGEDKCLLLLDFLFSGPDKQIEERRDQLLVEKHPDSARLLVSAWNAAVDFLEESARLLGTSRISQANFTGLFLAGLEGLSLRSIPPGIDRVRVGSLQQMALLPCKILFILGTLESAFPPGSQKEGFLLDQERELLADRLGRPFPNRKKDQPAAQAWLIHALKNRPENELILSVPSLGDDSSRIYDEWMEEEEAHETLLAEWPDKPDPRWYSEKTAARYLQGQDSRPGQWQGLLGRLLKDIPQKLEAAAPRAEKLQATPQRVLESLDKRTGISASLIQTFNLCPYQFFMNYLAGASERPLAADRPDFQGTLLHRVMELAVRDLLFSLDTAKTDLEREARRSLWQDALTPSYFRRLYFKAAEDQGLAWYSGGPMAGGIGERVLLRSAETLRTLEYFNREDAFLPGWLEWSFPQRDAVSLILQADGRDYPARGLIDRIDVNPQGRLRLFDYKRTGKAFSWLDLLDGTDIQLPFYKKAFESAYPDRTVDSMLFAFAKTDSSLDLGLFSMPEKDRTPDIRALEKQEEAWQEGAGAKAADYAMARAVESLQAIHKGRFPARPAIREKGAGKPCAYCSWRAACGYDGRLQRSRPLPSGSGEEKAARESILEAES